MLTLGKKYYCVESKKKRNIELLFPKFFICKAKNKNKAIKKFYKKFNKNDYEIKDIYPLVSLRYQDFLFYLE